MSAVKKPHRLSVEDYLAGELVSEVKHEYLGGFVYAIAGARNVHNLIAGNAFASLHRQLRSQRCRPYNSDAKIRVKLPTHVRFYYPDASVICDSNPQDESFQDRPLLVIEVLASKTRRVDEGEKKDAYLTIPSLYAYIMFEQTSALATVSHRTEQGFVQETCTETEAVIPLPEVCGIELPLLDVYEGVEFVPEMDEEP